MNRKNTLITIDGVKQLLENETKFEIDYNFVGNAKDGCPRFEVFYLYEDVRAQLIAARIDSTGGVMPRIFKLWPGLVQHHVKFGGDNPMHLDIN
jgi:hypothetical protein